MKLATWNLQRLTPVSDPARCVVARVIPPHRAPFIVYGTVLPWPSSTWRGLVYRSGLAFGAALEAQAPAPLFEAPDGFTRAVLFAHKPLGEMDKTHRVRACYLHACLRYVQREFLTNTSLRERFRIDRKNSAVASRLIREAMEAGVLVPFDAGASRQQMKYVPWWAGAGAPDAGARF
jgi:hypothetical protein